MPGIGIYKKRHLRRINLEMPLISIEDAIKDIKAGKMVILVDDEDRENEGDLTIAAETVTPEIINFMAKYGRGLICLSLTGEKMDSLNLPMMVNDNTSRFNTGLPFPSKPDAA